MAGTSRNVPGVLVRSISTTATGTQAPQTPSFITGHESPLSQRWGGWYVTGTAGAQAHMGATDLSPIDTSTYLAPTSDIVAHLVLAHQTQMHNLITLTNYETRLAQFEGDSAERYEKAAEELVRYLLFADEAPLTDAVKGASEFAHEFASRGPSDGKGRSLRQFDLKTRLSRTLQLPHLLGGLRCAAGDGQGMRLPPAARGVDRTRSERGVCEAHERRPPGRAGDPAGDETGLPDEWNAYRTKTKGGRT